MRISDWSSDVCSSDLVGRYGVRPKQGIISGLNRSPGKLLVGTLAGLRPVKNLRRLVRAVASHDDKLQLVIVGEGPERGAIRAEAAACGLSDLCLPGFMNEPWNFIGLFRSEAHTSELQSLHRHSYAVFHLKKTTDT